MIIAGVFLIFTKIKKKGNFFTLAFYAFKKGKKCSAVSPECSMNNLVLYFQINNPMEQWNNPTYTSR